MKTVSMIAAAGALLLSVGGAGCSGGHHDGSDETSLTGTVSGQALAVVDGVSLETTQVVDGQAWSILYVTFYDTANVCALIQQSVDKANATGLEIEIDHVSAAPLGPVRTGSYAVTVGDVAPNADGVAEKVRARFFKGDAMCQGTIAEQEGTATQGSVQITSRTPSEIRGEVDLTFPQGSIKGSFVAPICTFNPAKYENGVRTCEML